jgi:hypothetical protein
MSEDVDQPPTTEQPGPTDVLVIERRPGESEAGTIARYALMPEVGAGLTIQQVKRSKLLPLEITPLIAELAQQTKAINDGDLTRGEAMLAAQATTLDAMFHKLVRFGLQNMQEGYPDAAEQYMRLGFKAQAQCRSVWEALNEIKNPRPVAFIKQQTNVAAGHQQVVNNARGESEIPPNELNEAKHEQPMDIRGQTPAIGANQAVAAVGAIDGATIARGPGAVIAERRQGKCARAVASGRKAAKGV